MSHPVHSHSNAPLVDLCAEVPTLLTSVRNAWATWQEAASNAHLAALMPLNCSVSYMYHDKYASMRNIHGILACVSCMARVQVITHAPKPARESLRTCQSTITSSRARVGRHLVATTNAAAFAALPRRYSEGYLSRCPAPCLDGLLPRKT